MASRPERAQLDVHAPVRSVKALVSLPLVKKGAGKRSGSKIRKTTCKKKMTPFL